MPDPASTSDKRAAPAILKGLSAGGRMLRLLALLLLIAFCTSGITTIQPGEVGLILRMGRLAGSNPAEQVHGPGLLFALPYPIDEVIRVPVKQEGVVEINALWNSLEAEDMETRFDPMDEGYVLTGDRNMLQLKATVRYRISDPIAYALTSVNPEQIVTQVVTTSFTTIANQWSAQDTLRLQSDRVLVQRPQIEKLLNDFAPQAHLRLPEDLDKRLDSVFTDDQPHEIARAELASFLNISARSAVIDDLWSPLADNARQLDFSQQVRQHAETCLVQLGCGVTLTAIEVGEVHPPRHVLDAFEMAQSARIQQETLLRETEGYRQELLIRAEGLANQTIREAEATRTRLAGQATADAEVFSKLAAEYQSQPALVWQRLYRDALEEVLIRAGRRYFVPSEPTGGPLRIEIPQAPDEE